MENRYIKTFENFNREDINDILLELSDIGINYQFSTNTVWQSPTLRIHINNKKWLNNKKTIIETIDRISYFLDKVTLYEGNHDTDYRTGLRISIEDTINKYTKFIDIIFIDENFIEERKILKINDRVYFKDKENKLNKCLITEVEGDILTIKYTSLFNRMEKIVSRYSPHLVINKY